MGTYGICLGPDFAFGSVGSENSACLLDTCPPFDAEGSGLYIYLGGLLSMPLAYETADLDSGGIADHYETALAEAVLCEGRVPWAAEASCIYRANKLALEAEASYANIQAYSEVLAMLLSISVEMQQALVTALGLTGSYDVFSNGAEAIPDELAPNGDPDGDGYTNLQEYLNVIADGGGEAEYVAAALNPLLDGTAASVAAVPVGNLLGLAALLTALIPVGIYALRRHRAR